MKPGWNPIAQGDLEKLTEAVSADFGTNVRRQFSEVATMLDNGLLVTENMNAAFIKIKSAVHNTPTIFANPLKSAPKFFTPAYALLPNGTVALQPLGTVPITRRVVGGVPDPKNYLATVRFDLPANENLEVLRTTNSTALTSGATTDITWTGTTNRSSPGSALSWNGTTTINILEDGLYLCHLRASWAPNVTGRRSIIFGGSVNEINEIGADPDAASNTQHEVNIVLPLVAGNTVKGQGNQASGGALALVGAGTLAAPDRNATKMSITRLKNTTTNYTADVYGVLWGG